MDLKDFIKQLRVEKGWSVYDMADKTGYSHGLINQVELGKKNITEKFLKKLIETFPIHEKKLRELYYMDIFNELPDNIKEKIKGQNITRVEEQTENFIFKTYNFYTNSDGEIDKNDLLDYEFILTSEKGREIENRCIVVKVNGDDLKPAFFNGDIVAFLRSDFKNWQLLDNKIILVEMDKKLFLKKLIFENGIPYLHAFNERLYPKKAIADNVKYIGRPKYRLSIDLDNFSL